MRAVIRIAAAFVLAATATACFSPPPPPADGRTPIWIDSDVSIGEPDGDVADGFALIQAFRSDTVVVRGVSAVHGKAPLVRTWPITQDLVQRFGPEGLRPWRGAAGPHELRAPTEASEALATALRAERLTIVALGPLTTIASTLRGDSDLAVRMVRIVAAVRQAHVALDAPAMRAVLESGVPLTIVPFEASANVRLTDEDLARLDDGPVSARFLAESSRARRRAAGETSDVDEVQLFETLAVDVVAAPDRFVCDSATASVDSDAAPVLVIREGAGAREVTHCHTPDDGFKERLMKTLAGPDD